MESFFFHKPIPILLYIDVKTVLKVRNISKGMRYRIKVLLRDKKVFLNIPDTRGNVLNGHIWTREDYPMPKGNEDFIQGLASYESKGEYEMEYLKEAFGEIYCSFNLKFRLRKPYFVERSCFLAVNKRTFKFLKNLSIGRMDELYLFCLSSSKIAKLLGNIRQIDFLALTTAHLDESVSFALKTVNRLELANCQVKSNIWLPKVESLKVMNTETDKLVVERLIELEAENIAVDSNFINWLKKQKCLKRLKISTQNASISVLSLPSSLRHLNLKHLNLENDAFLLKECPYLISFKGDICLDLAVISKIRKINCGLLGTLTGKSKLRQATLRDDNIYLINKCPEILSICTVLSIKTESFNFSNISSSIRVLHFHVPIYKGMLLIRNTV